jgi:tetratricopeptide (TPR) repeat protein
MGDLYQKPLLGAYYSEEKVKLKADLRNIREAADRYFYSTNNLDEHLKTHMFEKGAEYYNKFLKLDSNDLDAKINLAVCYVESSKEPMKGIGLLREVLEKDSNNIKAHLNLGYFAIKSGQFDKAIGRFEKVLKIEPKNQEALLYLGDVYESQGNIEKAITYYEKYKASLTDKAIAIEVQTYIEKLKNKLQTI